MTPRLNTPYVAVVCVVATATLGFIAWAITAQVYRQWASSMPIGGGWNWPAVFVVDALCLVFALGLYWKIYADSNVSIDTEGVSRPSLRGLVHIAWIDVTNIEVFGGVGFHICAGKRKVVVSPYAYRNPELIIQSIQEHMASRNESAA